jgi:hypothetical protein
MDTNHITSLLRSLATTPSRRGVARTLAALTLGGGVAALAGHGTSEAKKKCRNKKKKCPTPPFCTGKNICFSGENFECDSTGDCFCFLAAETGAPFCGHVPGDLTVVELCTGCDPGTTCVFAASFCANQPFACVPPCPNPF